VTCDTLLMELRGKALEMRVPNIILPWQRGLYITVQGTASTLQACARPPRLAGYASLEPI
jgi:hypothetical protein